MDAAMVRYERKILHGLEHKVTPYLGISFDNPTYVPSYRSSQPGSL